MKQGFFSRLTGIPPTEHPRPIPEAPAVPTEAPPRPSAGPATAPPEVEKIVDEIVRRGLPLATRKTAVSLRLDAEVLDWFKARGTGYQTRINAVLRAYVEAAEKA